MTFFCNISKLSFIPSTAIILPSLPIKCFNLIVPIPLYAPSSKIISSCFIVNSNNNLFLVLSSIFFNV